MRKLATIHTTISVLESSYAKNVPEDVPTALEASTNSFHIAKLLAATGCKAFVPASDILSGLSRQDRVNDRIAAEKLARVALNGDDETLRFVFTPSELGAGLREDCFAYRDTRKDSTRAANRIWSFCSRHSLDVDRRIDKKHCEDLLRESAARGWSGRTSARLEGLVEEWWHAETVCREREKAIDNEVFHNPEMTRLQ